MSTQFLHYVWRYHVWLFFKHVYHILSFRERYAPTYHGMCYLYRIFCPEDGHTSTVSLWTIMSKVRLEAFMWVSCIMHDKNAITFLRFSDWFQIDACLGSWDSNWWTSSILYGKSRCVCYDLVSKDICPFLCTSKRSPPSYLRCITVIIVA